MQGIFAFFLKLGKKKNVFIKKSLISRQNLFFGTLAYTVIVVKVENEDEKRFVNRRNR